MCRDFIANRTTTRLGESTVGGIEGLDLLNPATILDCEDIRELDDEEVSVPSFA